MDDKERNFYEKIKDAVSAYVLHDPNAQAATAFDREKRMKSVDERTLSMFRESAEAGHPFSCFNLGRCYETGSGVEQDLEQAYEWYRKAAAGGDVNAWLALAKMFDTGTYVDRDPKEAAMWLSRAANKEHPIAMIGMGQKYTRGDGVERDHEKALELFKEARKLAPGIGSYVLGEAIGDGIGCKKDYAEAVKLFEEAHEHKFPLGTYNLGMMLEMGLGCEKDEKRGFQLITQAADEGIPEAMYRIAFHFREGTSEAQKDDKKAFEYFKKAADKGFPPALVEAGLCYENGVGTEMNKEEAFKCYEKGAKSGLHTAIVCLGVCYRSGIGCEADEEKALELMEDAVALGNTRAYHLMASFLFEEDPYDERAINLEMVAAKAGFARASLFLGGYFLQRGEAGPSDERAAHYFRMAAREGDVAAMFELADLLDTKENNEDEEIQKEIWKYYEESANAGHPLAAYKMALRYKDPEDRVQSDTVFPKDTGLPSEKRNKLEIHYISMAAAGGIPAACHEVADRSFWGDGLKVDIKAAAGLYNYCADELSSKDLKARYAFCQIINIQKFAFEKIGRYDALYADLVRRVRTPITEKDPNLKEQMETLSSLAGERVTDAMIFYPVAKALSYGQDADLSSEEDQACLSFIEEMPECRDKAFAQGLLSAILHPEDISRSIGILRYAKTEMKAGNVEQIMANLYHSLAVGMKKLRKGEFMVVDQPYQGWSQMIKSDWHAKNAEYRKKKINCVWSNSAGWHLKEDPNRLDLMTTSCELYAEALRTGQTEKPQLFSHTSEELTELRHRAIFPCIAFCCCMLTLLLPLLYAFLKHGSVNGQLSLTEPFRVYPGILLKVLPWALLAMVTLYGILIVVTEIQKHVRRSKLKKAMEKKQIKPDIDVRQ